MNDPQPQKDIPAPSLLNWCKRNYISLLVILFVIGISVALFIFRDAIQKLGNYGYLGAFLIAAAGNATIVLPMPGILVIVPLGAIFNPFLIGLAGAAGASLGEMTAYVAGYSSSGVWRNNKNYQKAVGWLQKWGVLTVFVVSATPLPFDVFGLAAGSLRFPAWKFFVACLPGKILKYVALSLLGYWGGTTVINDKSVQQILWITGGVILATMFVLALGLFLEDRTWKRRRKV
ncbi:MAG: VTT domain-containing protein [Dehalococcoidia bacterium]|nr:VTT domain-containing protein [Dehalococcoidia bacterium]